MYHKIATKMNCRGLLLIPTQQYRCWVTDNDEEHFLHKTKFVVYGWTPWV